MPSLVARLRVRPMNIKAALRFCKVVHRRLPDLQGAMWAVACERDELVGVAIVGRPNARLLDDGRRLQVLRVSCLPGDEAANGNKGACSILYGACARTARAMGATDLITYIHADEPGTSLRAAGWIEDRDWESRGGQWGRTTRPRQMTLEAGRKIRWIAPWSAMAAEIGRAA